MKTIKELAQTKWASEETARSFASLARAYLDQHGLEPISTSALYRGLGATLDDFAILRNHAYQARQAGLLDGYYSRSGKKTFGSANILWHGREVAEFKPSAPVMSKDQFRAHIRAMLANNPAALAEQEKQWAEDDAEKWLMPS